MNLIVHGGATENAVRAQELEDRVKRLEKQRKAIVRVLRPINRRARYGHWRWNAPKTAITSEVEITEDEYHAIREFISNAK